jgi:phenylacetate-CoA ligase
MSIMDFRDHLSKEFPFYNARFAASGVAAADCEVAALDLCPVLTRNDYALLERDVVARTGKGQFLADLSSGTTGPRRTRIATAIDDAAEAALCQRFFQQCGIGPDDRVLALDVGNPDLYVFYGEVLQRLGVDSFAFGSVTSAFDVARDGLFALSPTTLLTIPSVLHRVSPALLGRSTSESVRQPRRVIYLGETMPLALRRVFEGRGIEVFGFYGSTEIGSVAGECGAHQGMHIYNDAAVPTILEPTRIGTQIAGEVAWTTLHFKDHPLMKYATGDRVTIDTDPCDCGRSSPRLISVNRVEDGFVIFAHKFQHSMFLDALRSVGIHATFMQIEVTDAPPRIRVSFYLPADLQSQAVTIRDVFADVDEMPYLLDHGFVEYECHFVQAPRGSERKLRRVLDGRI